MTTISGKSANRSTVRAAIRSGVGLAAALLCGTLFSSVLHAAPQAGKTTKAASSLAAPDKSYGVKSAPIKMDVYSDYQCPYCRGFYDETLTHVIREYASTGKVYLVHHDFPLAGHKYSGEAARWANACAEVGQFDAAEAALYDHQDQWGADGNIGKYIAASMPVSDFNRVQAIMKGSAMPAPQATVASADPMAGVQHPCSMDPYIVQDIKAGYQIGAPGTPDFVITYKGQSLKPIYSSVSWPVLKQLFDTLLKQ